MKLLSKEILLPLGFIELPDKGGSDIIMAKNNFKLTLKSDGSAIYSNLGIDYPLKDFAALKKLYKEVKREDLT